MQNIVLSPVAISDLVDMIANEVESRLSHKPITTSSPPQPHIKGTHQLAKFLGISVSKAQKLKNEGIIPFFQNERLVLFDPEKVREAMSNYNKRKGKK
ncbi:MAG: DUF3853 family protein [Bacteroidota bacterium]